MIDKYGLQSFGVDPTLKHADSLRLLEQKTNGRFKHLKLAVNSVEGIIVFNESKDNFNGLSTTEQILIGTK